MEETYYRYSIHYISEVDEEGWFTQTQHLGWGYRYLGWMHAVLNELTKSDFQTLIDVGCGDGRFLREATKLYPDKKLRGVDYSEQAITLAKAVNPGIDYRCQNILETPINETFDVVTLIETLEHIPLENVDTFVARLREMIVDEGRLILTVPHRNMPLQKQHYQHFDRESLERVLAPHFEQRHYIPIDSGSYFLRVINKLLGGQGRHFLVTNKHIWRWFYNLYMNRFLYASDDDCMHLLAVCRRF